MAASEQSLRNSLNYHRQQRQHEGRQWQTLVQALAGEILTSAGPADAQAFFRHIGNSLARSQPIAEQATLQSLEQELNRIWSQLDWGWVSLQHEGNSLRITHGAYPQLDEMRDWLPILKVILEGCYQSWLTQQGGEVSLTVTCTAQEDDTLVLYCRG